MANADDVQHKLVDDGDKIALYEGADYAFTTGDARTWWNRLTWDLLRVLDGADQDKNGDGKSVKLGLRDSVRRIVFEATLWTPRLPLAELIAKRGGRDTLHGHARDAASYGDVSVRLLRRIAEKLEIDIDDLLE